MIIIITRTTKYFRAPTPLYSSDPPNGKEGHPPEEEGASLREQFIKPEYIKLKKKRHKSEGFIVPSKNTSVTRKIEDSRL